MVERRAGETTERALAWLDDPDPRPRFLWVHYQDPHGPYTPPAEDLAAVERPPTHSERELPVGEFVDVKITGYQDYDLLALPKGQKPAEFKVAKQAQ